MLLVEKYLSKKKIRGKVEMCGQAHKKILMASIEL